MGRKNSRQRKPDILYHMASLILAAQEKFGKPHRRGRCARERGREVLCRIHGPVRGKELYQEYQIGKWKKILTVFLSGMGIAGVLSAAVWLEGKDSRLQALYRPEAGGGDEIYELDAWAGEEAFKGIPVSVREQRLSKEEEEQVLKNAEEELSELMAERIPDPENICKDISLPESCCRGLADIRWESGNYDLIDGAGHVGNELPDEEGETVILTARLTCGERQEFLTFPLRIMPEGQDAVSRLTREIARKMKEEETEASNEFFVLPEEFEGRPLTWQTAKPAWGIWIALLTAAGCVALNAAFDQDLYKEGEKRDDALLRGYPAFLSRLALLAGTGMPLRVIFGILAGEGAKKGCGPVYEEVLRTYREMESGLTEVEAYENFGRRARLTQYRKCASLLAQNVRKGRGDLLAALGQEAENAFEEKKARARKKGEEAQTKLLLPMLMMLAVVMILIMVPACFSFGGM